MGPLIKRTQLRPPNADRLRLFRILGATTLFLLLISTGRAQTDQREYAIKAAYIFHFTQFIEWPPEALPNAAEPIRVGVVRPNPFGGLLEEILRDQKVHDRPIEVVDVRTPGDAEGCQILFIPQASGAAGRRLVAELSGSPILLIGEESEFVFHGGMIALVREGSRIGILINRDTLRESNLNASSRLLRLARIVEDRSDS